jgi:general secretion pathway protein E
MNRTESMQSEPVQNNFDQPLEHTETSRLEEHASRRSFLGEMLLARGVVNTEDLEKGEAFRNRIGGRLGPILVRLGAVSEDNLLQVLTEVLRMPLLEAGDLPLDPAAYLEVVKSSGIELDWWLDQEVLGWEDGEGRIRYIARDPLNDSVAEILRKAFPEAEIEFCLIRNYDLERALETLAKADRSRPTSENDTEQLRELAEEAPVIEFVNNLLSQAFDQRASDVHIEPDERSFEVRYRIDGVLYNRFTMPRERFAAISSRVKLISGMDIAERRLPQDGRLGMRLSGEEVDIRVSTVPGVHGESVVMRLLPKERQGFHLEDIGLEKDHFNMFQRWIKEPHGILLLTGPTGSGKSTTLYSALEAINDREKKIITVEDPVEYQVRGVTQIQTHSEIGYTFARALRSILRQDPDVIMVGEIRDKETAEIAIQASLTGHLVLSTLHTNDAVSAFTRLIDMGVEPFLVATPVRAVIAQRLVRRLCQNCAQAVEPMSEIQELTKAVLPNELKGVSPNWKAAEGCPACQGTGYKGRTGIHEMVMVTAKMQHYIMEGRASGEMRELARAEKSRTLREAGFLKAWQGITSVEEVLRVTAE